jgi:hypothetical protein
MREAGIGCRRGQRLSLDEKNGLRHASDARQLNRVIEILNSHSIEFSPENLLVLGQPKLTEEDLYWKSIEDLLFFTRSVARRRDHFSGDFLLGLFNEAKPWIMRIIDFTNPSIPFQEIIQNVTNEHLTAVQNDAIRETEREVADRLLEMTPGDLRKGLNMAFVGEMIGKCRDVFEDRAMAFFLHSLKYLASERSNYLSTIQHTITASCIQLFVSQCILRVIPLVELEIEGTTRDEIDQEMNQLALESVGAFCFTSLSSRHEISAESRLRDASIGIHSHIPNSPEFPNFIVSIREKISNYVKGLESKRKEEYNQHVKAEQEREKRELQAKYEVDLAEKGREFAEFQKKSAEEISKMKQDLKESEERHIQERRKDRAERDAENLRHENQINSILAAQEQSRRDFQDLLNRIIEQRKREQEKWERAMERQRELQEETIRELRDQVQQQGREAERFLERFDEMRTTRKQNRQDQNQSQSENSQTGSPQNGNIPKAGSMPTSTSPTPPTAKKPKTKGDDPPQSQPPKPQKKPPPKGKIPEEGSGSTTASFALGSGAYGSAVCQETSTPRTPPVRAVSSASISNSASASRYRRVELIGPYWRSSGGKGGPNTLACGWGGLVAEYRKPAKKFPYRVQQIKHVGTDDSIGWCTSSSLRFLD